MDGTVNYKQNIFEKLEFLHCLFQELEDLKIALPMGDYSLVYDIIEDMRDTLEIQAIIDGEIK